MKSLILGSFVTLIALTGGAVTSKKTNKKLNTFYYGNCGSGVYVLLSQDTADLSYCFSHDINPCMFSSEEMPVASFILGNSGQPSDIEQAGTDERLFSFIDE